MADAGGVGDGPVALIRTERPPSWESATARTHSSSPSSPSTTSASAPRGAEQPASRVASTARSAVTAARVARVVERGQAGHEVGVVGAALDRERALPGSGEHLERVEHLGGVVEAAEAGQAGAGQQHGVVLAAGDLADAGVHVAADAGDVQAQAEGLELGGAARGAGADPAALRQLAEGEAVTGDDDVAGVLARGTAASAMPSAGAVGRSLSEWTATSTSPRSRASRSALTNTPVPPRVASGAALTSPSVVMVTSSTSRPSRWRIKSATRPDWVVASAEARVPRRRTVAGRHGVPSRECPPPG